MNLLGIQIISIIFIVFMMYVVQIHYKKNELPRTEAIFWLTTFTGLALIVIIPKTASFVTSTFAVSRLTDFITAVALMIIFGMLIDLRIKMHKFNKKLESSTRDKAIKNARKI
jgi:hypothetical protein